MQGKASETGTNDSHSDDLTRSTRARRGNTMSTTSAVVIAIVLLLAGIGVGYLVKDYVGGNGSGGSGATYTIAETGSSLIYPLMNLWAPNYTALVPNVHITPASTGSGTGISSAESGTVDIGGTDAYLAPSTATNDSLLNFPAAISAQLIFYNLPGITAHLNLNGTDLAMIYAGKITKWNDPLIQAANPSVSLPDQAIIPLHRSDGSGDTYLFTSLCYMSYSGWTAGYGTTVSWISTSTGYQGNAGMVTGLQTTQYGIAYIGISYLTEAVAAGEQYAAVGDQAANVNGTNPANYIMPTAANISEDANLGFENLDVATSGLAVSLILGGVAGATDLQLGKGGTMPAPGTTPYPITNLEYLLVSTHPSSPTKQLAVVQFLMWGISYGNAATYMNAVHFVPLTAGVIGYDMQALENVEVSS